jgi:phosphoglycerate dehydrogenase-like enzyme
MKIVLHHSASRGFRDLLNRLAGDAFEIVIIAPDDEEVFLREMRDAEVLLHVLAPVSASIMDCAPRLKLIQKIGVGLDAIDLQAAAQRGIRVTNMPGTNSQGVAEMTLLLMLGALRRVAYFDAQTRAGKGWSLSPDNYDRLGEIAGRTVGLLGYGQVPKRIAPALRAMGATVIYHDVAPAADNPKEWRSFDDLIETSDIISLHLPLTDTTKSIINSNVLARVKPGVVLVNSARGGLIDESALIAALRDGRVAAAGLDTLTQEPPPKDHPLFALDNVVITPHIAWLTMETLQRSLNIALENCRRVQQGAPLLNEVSFSKSDV